MKRLIQTVLCTCVLSTLVLPAFAQGTATTYQGRLNDSANPANGTYDLTFTLYPASSGGSATAGPLTNAATAVSNGLFTVTLDFGNQFPGADRWLEIAVRTNGGGAFTTLAPRQPLTPTPYAIQAATATTASSASSVAAANISGTISLTQLPGTILTNNASGVTLNGSFTGNGAGVTNVPLTTLNGQGSLNFLFGAFPLASSPVVGISPRSVAAADVNGDGKLDLISANSGTNTLSVLTNNGSGGFALSASPVVGANPQVVLAVDVNGDGRKDLISANSGSDTLSVLTNDGSGGFILATSLSPGSGLVTATAADVNADGRVDLIAATASSILTSRHLVILTNNGNAGFVLSSSPSLGGGLGDGLSAVIAADVNGDNKVDLIAAKTELLDSGYLTILTNNGSGGFAGSTSYAVGTVFGSANSVAAGDMNGDGKTDLISANSGSTLTVLTNNGSGGFVTNATLAVGSSPRSVVATDVNGDGKLDLISANSGSDTLSILTNNGSGKLALASAPGVGNNPQSVAAGDWNGDGRVDLVSANQNSTNLSVLFNLLAPRFNTPISVAGEVTAGSFTGDGAGLTSLTASHLAGTISSNNIANGSVAANKLDSAIGVWTKTGTNIFYTGGNVGIGTDAPAAPLQVVGSGTNSLLRLQNNDDQNVSLLLVAPFHTWRIGQNNGDFHSDFFIRDDSVNQTRLSIVSATGNVGIGTESPASKLHVNGAVRASKILADEGAAGGGYGFIGDSQTGMFNPGVSAGAVEFDTLGAERMRITSTGNIGISTTTPVSELHVKGSTVLQGGITPTSATATNLLNLAVGSTANGFVNGISFYEGSANPAMSLGYDGTIAGTANNALRIYNSTGSNIFTFEHGGALGLGVVDVNAANAIQHSSGAVLTVGGSWVNASDRNAKENFAPVSAQQMLAKVAALPITRWNYRSEGGAVNHIGPMAQDFRAAFGLGCNETSIATVDADGVALAAIQGLNQKVEEQRAENAALKRELAELKELVGQLVGNKNGGAK